MATSTLIRIQSLFNVADTSGYTIIDIPMTSEDRQRVHRRIVAPDGQVFALELPTGSVLHVHQPLFVSESTLYRVIAAPEDVLSIVPASITEAARIGHLIGNLHRDIDLENGQIIALWTAPLEAKLQKLGMTFQREQRAFKGKPRGEHSH